MTNLIEHYNRTRKKTEELCQPLNTEDYLPQAADFTSPPKWHLAHTTWFFEEMILKKVIQNYQTFDPTFSFLFNSYYNSLGERLERHKRGLISRPTVDYVYQYRNYVDAKMVVFLANKPSSEIEELIITGINHEQQHQELLLTDLKYTFSQNPSHPKYTAKPLVNTYNTSEGWLTMAEGIYEIGHIGNGFCFDNELGRHKVYQHGFSISKALVTNVDFIAFIERGGYKNAAFWLDEGWAWANTNNITKPLYWYKIDKDWFYYTLAGLEKIDGNAILSHISYYEAAAFAAFKNCRLPTEFEWEIAADKIHWGSRWEWTNSAYLPYPNFKIKAGALGEYNGKFMVNQMVLRGGSVATAEAHSRKTYRNFFHPQMQWQFSGIRLAK